MFACPHRSTLSKWMSHSARQSLLAIVFAARSRWFCLRVRVWCKCASVRACEWVSKLNFSDQHTGATAEKTTKCKWVVFVGAPMQYSCVFARLRRRCRKVYPMPLHTVRATLTKLADEAVSLSLFHSNLHTKLDYRAHSRAARLTFFCWANLDNIT